ncbi:MAG: hypothetical protein HYY93_09015 [Planctomycetes bacterium]|nr:hypothetical protein [Planctomycetota bacterium]
MAILEICHRVVRTKEIALQWEKHASRFSRKWMFSMYAKKKLDEDLQPREMIIDTSGFSAADSAAVEDDRHLLEAAAAADHIIITRDDRLQTVLGRHHSTKEILGAFVWINPVRDPRSVLEAF